MMLTMKCYGYKAPPGYCHKIGRGQFNEVPSRDFYKSILLHLPLDIYFLTTKRGMYCMNVCIYIFVVAVAAITTVIKRHLGF